MRAVEMYTIIVVTLITTAQGLPQTCVHYCNFLPEYSSIPPECDCSLHTLPKNRVTTSNLHISMPPEINDSEIYYEPSKLKSSQNTSFDELVHVLNLKPSFESKQNIFTNTNNNKHLKTIVNTGESFGQDGYDENDSKAFKKYKRGDNYFPKMLEETKDVPLHLYLDIDLNVSENSSRSQLEGLKNMFKNFQTAEKDMLECINLHIYIFSKHIDTINKTNKNWGYKSEDDNISSFQELTEVQSKCDQPVSIIKQSIYQIKHTYSREEQITEKMQDEENVIYRVDSNKDTAAPNAIHKSKNDNNTTTMYTTLTINPTDDVYSGASEPAEIVAQKAGDIQLHKTYLKQDDLNLFNDDLSDMKDNDFTRTSPFYDYDDPTVYNKVNVATFTDTTPIISDYDNLRTTSQTDRKVLSEEDLRIPRIITKELSNGTVTSVVDGYENIPNSDFTTNSIISTNSNKSTNSNTTGTHTNIDKIIQSDFVEIQGNLYFSFGEKQIPARFIQQSDGELNVAIDGFSLCDQMLEEHTSNFMSLLCKCIQLQKCT